MLEKRDSERRNPVKSDPIDILATAYKHAVRASNRPWDFSDRCAVLIAFAMTHLRVAEFNSERKSTADFLWQEEVL